MRFFFQVSLFGDDDDDVSSSDDYSSNRRSWKRNVILEILRHILKLECISTPERAPLKATACYLYGTNSAALCSFLSELRPRLVKDRLQGPKATFQLSELSSLQSAEVFHLQEDGLPVIPVFVDNGSGSIVDQSFSPRVYFDHLKTKVLGCVVWYGKVMTSTMDIFYR